MENSTNQQVYSATVRISLNQTEVEVVEEFEMAQSVTYVDLNTIEVLQDIVAPDKQEAYRRACDLVSAVLDARGLQDEYQLAGINIQSEADASQLDPTKICVCKVCGESRFSWLLTRVQFGAIHRSADGQYSEEGTEKGPITGTDVNENGVFCVECAEFRDLDELVSLSKMSE